MLSHASTRDLLFSQAQPPKCANDGLSVGKIAVAFSLYMNVLGPFLVKVIAQRGIKMGVLFLGFIAQ